VKLADISIRRPIFALMMTVSLVVFGVFSYGNVGVDLYPNVEFPFVTVQVTYPGADPEAMEEKVAKPIEDALSSMGGIKMLMSTNLESVTMVMIQFELDVDRDQATQDVRDRISAIDSSPGIGRVPGGSRASTPKAITRTPSRQSMPIPSVMPPSIVVPMSVGRPM